jgi:heat-inducible transcriptional repressor
MEENFEHSADAPALSDRERQVLLYIIEQHVLTAQPVGSRSLSKLTDLQLSPASIRNVMADLEEIGLIGHPHTSAGRVPTDKGYRYYVDSMMQDAVLADDDRALIDARFCDAPPPALQDLIRTSSHILSRISRQLAIVAAPSLAGGVLERLELVPVASDKVMVILSIASGIIKTIIMHVRTEVNRDQLDNIAVLLNERLAGLTLREIRQTFNDRMRDSDQHDRDIIRLFIDSSDKLFEERIDSDTVCIEGMQGVTTQPEFEDRERLRNIIALVENQDIIVHIVDSLSSGQSLTVRIGAELRNEKMNDYSIIASPYRIGGLQGAVSIIGPKRMDYPRMVAIVDYLARVISS